MTTETVEMLSPEGKCIWATFDYVHEMQKVGGYYTEAPDDHDDGPPSSMFSIVGDREYLGDEGSDSLWVDDDGALWMRKHFRQAGNLATADEVAMMRREADVQHCLILLIKAIDAAKEGKLPVVAELQAAFTSMF